MHHPVTGEFRAVQGRDHPEHPLLLSEFQIGLKTYQIEQGAVGVFHTQLEDRPGPVAGAGIPQPHRLHRAETDGIQPPGGQHLDGHTTLVHPPLPVERVLGGGFRRHQGGVKGLVFLLVQRTVDVIPRSALLPVIAGGTESAGHVHTFGGDDGGRCVEKAQGAAAQLPQGGGQRLRGQRAGGDDRRQRRRQIVQTALLHPDEGMGADPVCDIGGKAVPIHGQGSPGGNRADSRSFHTQRAQPPHFLLEQARGAVRPGCLQGVGADQLRENRAVMGRGG